MLNVQYAFLHLYSNFFNDNDVLSVTININSKTVLVYTVIV